MKIKWWHGILLTVGVLMLVGGLLAVILPTIDNPRYAPGEATAIVESTYHWLYNSADLYSPLSEEYLGQGIWEVKSIGSYVQPQGGAQAVFRVYETTGTVGIYNNVAVEVLNRREQLEQERIDEPKFTAAEVSVIVQSYILTQTIYSGFLNKVGYPVQSVSMRRCHRVGNSLWSGQCYAHYGSQQHKLLDWNFSEKTLLVSYSDYKPEYRNPFR